MSSTFSPNLLLYKFNSNSFKFEGSYLMQSPNYFTFSLATPKSLSFKLKERSNKLHGRY